MRQLLKLHFDMDNRTACNMVFCFVFPVSFLVTPEGLLDFLPVTIPWMKDFRELLVVTPGSRAVCWFRVQHASDHFCLLFTNLHLFTLKLICHLMLTYSVWWGTHHCCGICLTGKAYYCQQTWRSDSALPFLSWKVNKMSPSQHWCLEGHGICSSLSWEGSIKLFLFFFSVLISVLFYESIPSHMAVQFLLQFVLRNLVKSVLKIQVCYVCWMWLLIPFKNSVRLLGQNFSSQKARLYPSKQSAYVRAQWLYVFL